jgi:hypothetical protein
MFGLSERVMAPGAFFLAYPLTLDETPSYAYFDIEAGEPPFEKAKPLAGTAYSSLKKAPRPFLSLSQPSDFPHCFFVLPLVTVYVRQGLGVDGQMCSLLR